MKTKLRFNSLALAVVLALAGSAPAVRAASGTWTNKTGSLWSVATNWLSGTVADGSGNTADFSTIDITSGVTVNVDTARTIGNMIFGDTTISSAASWTLSNTTNALTLAGTTPTITVNTLGAASQLILQVRLAGSSGMTFTGTGIATMQNIAATYTGDTVISGGRFKVEVTDGLPHGVTYGNVVINTPGILDAQNNLTVNGLSGNGAMAIVTGNSATRTLTVGDNNASSSFNGWITNSTGNTLNLTKIGTGTLTLNSTNTYGGKTTITAGKLVLGASAIHTNTPEIAIASNAVFDVTAQAGGFFLNPNKTLSGSGSVAGSFTVATNATNIAGTLGTFGTLTFSNNLTYNGGGRIYLDLANTTGIGGGTNDLIDVVGNLTLNGSNTIYLNLVNGALANPGTYTLMRCAGTRTGGAANLGLVAPTIRGTITLDDTTNPKEIRLVVSGTPASLTWKGDGTANNWQVITGGWLNGAAADLFYQNDSVTFDNTGSNTPSINLVGTLLPGSVTVSASKDYTFAGSGKISGLTGLDKEGTGTLTLSATNDFTGPITLGGGTLAFSRPDNFVLTNTLSGSGVLQQSGSGVLSLGGITTNFTGNANITAGMLQVGYGSTLGGISGNITNNGLLSFFRSDTVTNASTISGTGSLRKIGGNNLILSGNNIYSGQTLVGGGVLTIPNNQALGNSSAVMVSNGTTLRLTGGVTVSNRPLTLLGGGTTGGVDNQGPLQSTNGINEWAGPVTLGADQVRIGALGNSTFTISGVIDSGANNYGLAARASDANGTLVLSASNTWKGPSTIIVGNLRLAGGDNRLPIGSSLTIGNTSDQNSSLLDLAGQNQQLAGLISLGSTMPVTVTNSGGPAALTLAFDAATNAFRGPIGGNIALTKAGTGTETLSGTNLYTGNTLVNAGTLKLGLNNAVPGGAGKGDVTVNGTLDLGGFSEAVNGLNGSGVINNSSGAGTYTLTVGGNDASGNFSGVISNTSGTVALTKTGAGTQTLGGANAYSGGTTIGSGTLALGAVGSLGSGPVSITPGTVLDATARGSFTLASGQTLTAGRTSGFANDILGGLASTGTVNVAGTAIAGTLTISGGLSLAGGTINYDLGNVTTAGGGLNDLIAINGPLNLSGSTVINPTFIGGLPANGAYTLIGGGSSVSGSAAANLSLVWPSSTIRQTATLDTTTAPGNVLLQVSGSGALLRWVGTNGGIWDINATTNWDNLGVPDRFLTYDSVTFDDSASNSTVNVTVPVTPSAMVVSNSSLPYTIGGASKITGGASITKQGAGTLTINNANDYTGPTVITGGVLKVGNVAALGATNNGTFATNGGTLDLANQMLGNEVIAIQGAGASGLGALINSVPGFTANYGLRFLTLAGDATVGGQGRFDLKNAPTVLGNGFTLTKVGTNTVTITDAGDTGFGDININEGAIQVQGYSLMGLAANTVNIGANGTMSFFDCTATNTKPVALNGGRLWVRSGSAAWAGTASLTGNNSFQVDATALSLLGPVSGTGSFTKSGGGVLNLYSTNSSYAGAILSSGTVNVGASGALVGSVSNNAALAFVPAAGNTITVPANITGPGTVTQPGTGLGTTVLSGTNAVNSAFTISTGMVEIAGSSAFTGLSTVAGGTLRIASGGALCVGTLSIGQNILGSTNLVLPGGVLSVGYGSTNDLTVGTRTINTTINPRGRMDLSGAASFTANVGNLWVGVSTEGTAAPPPLGALLLATNNTILATNIAFGHVLLSGGFADNLTNTVRLGSGSNLIQTPVMLVGGNKMSVSLTLPAGGSFALNNGATPTDLSVGSTRLLTSGSPGVSADLSAGTFQASLGSLVVGHKDKGLTDNNSGPGTNTVAMTVGTSSANKVTANTVAIGELLDGAGGRSYGTLTVGGGQFSVASNVTLATLTGTGTASGNLNLTGGTFSVAGDIVDGGGTSTLLLDGATLDLQPAGDPVPGVIGSVPNPINNFTLRSGTLKNVAEINGGAPFAKTGSGTLVLDGNNSFTSTFTVSNGTFLVKGQSGSAAIVAEAGTLGGSGSINGPVSVHANGTLALGPAITQLTINSTLTLAGTNVMKLNRDGSPLGSDFITGLMDVTYGGRLVVLNLGSPLVAGDSFWLFDAPNYYGSFAAFDLPALSPGLGWDTAGLTYNGSITVVALPSITAFTPESQAVECLSPATFTVTATGDNLSYRWFHGATLIPSATGPELSLTSVSLADAGIYTVQVSNNGGSTNASGLLTVPDAVPPQITCPGHVIVTNILGGGTIATYSASATDNCGVPVVTCLPPSGSSFALGTTVVQCTATDASNNTAGCQFSVEVRTLLQATGHVALEGYVGPDHNGYGTREVVFKATDDATNVLAIWTNSLSFAPDGTGYGVAPFTLANLPVGTTHLSAKTAWNLRKRLAVSFTDNMATAEFTSANELLGGDIHGSNDLVDVEDYFQLAAAWYQVNASSDIDGSGLVDVDDYFILASHWYDEGDPN